MCILFVMSNDFVYFLIFSSKILVDNLEVLVYFNGAVIYLHVMNYYLKLAELRSSHQNVNVPYQKFYLSRIRRRNTRTEHA